MPTPESQQPTQQEQKLSRELTSIESDYLIKLTKELNQMTGNKSLTEITEKEFKQYSVKEREKMIKLSSLIKDLVEGNKEELKERAREETIEWLKDNFAADQPFIDNFLEFCNFDQAPLIEYRGELDISRSSISYLPACFKVTGFLNLSDNRNLEKIENYLEVEDELSFANCENLTEISGNIKVKDGLYSDGCSKLSQITGKFSVGKNLHLSFSGISELPTELSIGGSIFLQACYNLKKLPDNLFVHGDLDLGGCTSLEKLPANLHVEGNFYLDRCLLKDWPEDLTVEGDLSLDQVNPDLIYKLQTKYRHQIKGQVFV